MNQQDVQPGPGAQLMGQQPRIVAARAWGRFSCFSICLKGVIVSIPCALPLVQLAKGWLLAALEANSSCR